MDMARYAPVPGSTRAPLPGARAMGRVDPEARIDVLVKLRRKLQPPEPGWKVPQLSREAIGETYGSSQEDIEAATLAFQQMGLTIEIANPATHSIDVSGTVAQLERAFHTMLFNFHHPLGDYRGRTGPLHLPVELIGLVQGVFGLDNRRVARRRKHPAARGAAAHAVLEVPATWWLPAELAKRYNFPKGSGLGQAIAVLEFDGGYFAPDLQSFCTQANVSVPKVVTVSVDGTATNKNDDAKGEVMLDIEVIAGVCPAATIVAYFAHFGDRGFIKAIDAVLQDSANRPSVVSISWGNPEEGGDWTSQAMAQVGESLKDAALAGVTICVSAGDDGSSDAVQDGRAHVDFPASSPYVLAIGGTAIPAKNAPLPDIVWFEGSGMRDDNVFNSGSTGGGVSSVFPVPDWQRSVAIGSVNPGAIAGRVVPDIALNADWGISPYLLVMDGQAFPNGGTSAASPLAAAMFALINENRGAAGNVGYITPFFYAVAAGGTVGSVACDDVAAGSNATSQAGGYKAGPGFDAVSGWGTPDGTRLMQALATI